jgi:EAL domain-containing protein (putative c-di-GMP-specific phosphodiesterase class I)
MPSAVTAITRLAESLKLAVTAEGIEDETIEARLRSIGRYTGQGWLFGRPMPAGDVRTMLAQRGLLPNPGVPMPLGVRKAKPRTAASG